MKPFLKAQLSSLLATAVDFLLMVACVEFVRMHYIAGVVVGAFGGAFTNFVINRHWSFAVANASLRVQALKYALVWTGSLLLNVFGVYLLTGLGGFSYILSKIIVAVSVGLGFNYLLQKQYVFGTK
jgi:putative flippase GtrA